jgi:hypothetical protein
LRVAVHKTVNRSAAPRPAAEAHIQRPAAASVHVLRPAAAGALQMQSAMQISAPSDPAEREADAVARNVVRMPLPASRQAARLGGASQVARKAEGQPRIGTGISAGIAAGAGSGAPLPPNVRRFMEPRFRADFRNVRIHTGERAATLSRQLNAQAFTVGNQIFFAKDRFRPETEEGRELIAHELTHTIQQQAVVQRKAESTVSQRVPAQVQRLGLSDILDGLADLAANVPGFTLLTVIIARNPINMRAVERNAVNLLRGFMGLIPGGEILFQVLQRYGIVERIGQWVREQTEAMGLSFQGIRDAFTRFTDSLSWRDIFSPGDVWRRAQDLFTPTIARIRNFVSGLVSQAIAWLKETFMQPLSNFCREIPGYALIAVQLGRDPFTNSPVARTAMNVVRAVAEFIPGGRERVDQLAQSGALARAYNWFMEETRARNLTWDRITGTFAQAWNALRLEDVLHPIDTLQRMVGIFRPLLTDLAGFARAALMKLAEFIFEAAMGAGGARIIAIFKRARDTFQTIIRDPVGFLRNLLAAVGQGVRQFMSNILTHLRDGVIAWLTGPVAQAGIQMPERWDLRGIIWFVLQILGLTWTRIRQKLVRLMGERAVGMLESGFQLIQEIRERGLVQALRDRVTEFFGTLRDAALGGIRSFIQQRLVMAGITQLLSMLNPVGAVIQAIIKTYTTIQFFIQKINQILELVESIVNSIAAIAAGAIASAANFVERTMARTIPMILDFLARFIGLGDVGAQVQATIRGLQARVDQMLDRAVDWIRRQAASLASRALGGDPNATPQQRLERGVADGRAAVNRFAGRRVGALVLRPLLAAIRLRHQMQSLEALPRAGRWVVRGVVNPEAEALSDAEVEGEAAAAAASAAAGGGVLNAPVYGPLTGEFGTSVSVRLQRSPSGSSPPSAVGPIWHILNERRDGGSYYYVRGHLLNDNFGGPGGDWKNLTPLTQATNNRSAVSMLRTIENTVRTALSQGRMVDFGVSITYGAPDRSADADDARRKILPEDEGTAIAQIIEAEQHVPTAVHGAAHTVAADNTRTQIVQQTVRNTLDTNIDHYTRAASPRRIVRLNTASAPELMTLNSVDATLAAQIIAQRTQRQFRDKIDARTRIGDRTWHAMVSTAGISVRC